MAEQEDKKVVTNPPIYLDARPMPTNTLELREFIKQEVARQLKDIVRDIRLQAGVR